MTDPNWEGKWRECRRREHAERARAENAEAVLARVLSYVRGLNGGKPCCPLDDYEREGELGVCYVCRCYFGAIYGSRPTSAKPTEGT